MKLILHPYDLELTHEFKIAHDARTIQKTLIIELQSDKHSGFGEATASNYYHIDRKSMVDELEANRAFIDLILCKNPLNIGLN